MLQLEAEGNRNFFLLRNHFSMCTKKGHTFFFLAPCAFVSSRHWGCEGYVSVVRAAQNSAVFSLLLSGSQLMYSPEAALNVFLGRVLSQETCAFITL